MGHREFKPSCWSVRCESGNSSAIFTKLEVATWSGQRDADADFDLDADNTFPLGMTFANDQFHVVDQTDDKVYVYTLSGIRDSAADFDLDANISSGKGITHADGRFTGNHYHEGITYAD